MLFPPPEPPRQPPRIVVTGAGIVTALGTGWAANARGFRMGNPVFRPVTLFDVSQQRARIAAEVDLPAKLPPLRLSEKTQRRLDRAARMLLFATREAWDQSGWEPSEGLPVVLGSTSGGMSLGQAYLRQAVERPGFLRQQASRIAHYQLQRQGLDLCEAFGFQGPITMIANACASGANAIGHAWELLRHGQARRALAGGYDALCHLTFAGFDSLQALSPTPSRPFDAQRNGLSLGEGAAILTLETLEGARDRGAEVLGEIIGYGAVTDTYHLTQPHPQGNAALAAMSVACSCAGVSAKEVDYINAHGTGTPQNDATETAAINRWGDQAAKDLRVSSTKGIIGHLLGAAGAAEAVVSLMTLREQFLPPQVTLENPDPDCRFKLVREPMETKVDVVLSNSFGFGGANASLLFRRWG